MDDSAPTPDAAPASQASAAATATAWEGPTPDVVAWTLVNWHNRHPLARRIGIKDVHTVGAVALPFMAQALPKEPSLEGGTTDAAPPAPAKRRMPWQRKTATGGPRRVWSDEFIEGLKPAAVASLALNDGFTSAPDDLPLRRVDISDTELAAGGPNQSGAWPMELVLLSAAFDAGPARRRVLVGRRDKVLGRRAYDPIRLGAAGGVVALLLIVLIWAMWPAKHVAEEEAAHGAASAASAASASASATAASAADEAASEPAPVASESAVAASEPEASASEAAPVASAPAAPASIPGPIGIPSIRPSLRGSVARPPAEASAPQGEDKAPARGTAASTASSGPVSEAEKRVSTDDAGLGSVMKRGAPGDKVVALVTLPQKTKPEAEAQLVRMREMISQTMGGAAVPNGEVFQTKEGWRAAVWPFSTREEAQLINATLLARGMRARAVDF